MKWTTIAAALSLALAAQPAMSQDILKFGGVLPPRNPIVTKGVQVWMRAIEKNSGGAVTFHEFWGGQLVRSPAKQVEAILNGIQDASFISSAYTPQRFPEVPAVTFPYVVRDGLEGSFALWRMYEKGMLAGFHDLYLAGIFANDHAGIHVTKEIKSIDEVRGLKIRISGPDEANFLRLLGAVPVGMRINAGAQAMHRGVVDGTFNAWAATAAFRMTPLVKTFIDEPLGVRVLMVVLSRSAVGKLSAKSRKALDAESGLKFSMLVAKVLDDIGQRVRKQARANPKQNVITLDDAAARKLKARSQPLIDEWIAKIPDGAKKFAVMQAALKEYRAAHR